MKYARPLEFAAWSIGIGAALFALNLSILHRLATS